jgi:GNAT superfamily N-acetyltransferase
MEFAMSEIVVRRAEESDLAAIAKINAENFAGNRADENAALEWVSALFRANPAYQYFVAVKDDEIVGYIGWQLHGGLLRPEPVIELEQLAIRKVSQSQGVGSTLMRESTVAIATWMRENNPRLEGDIMAVVWAYTDNLGALTVYARDFNDGAMGFRIQYDGKSESMLRLRIPGTPPGGSRPV